MSDNLGWNLPPGVTNRDISPPEPVECDTCEGRGHLTESSCCGVAIKHDDDGYFCSDCLRYFDPQCEECNGEGVIDP